MSFHDLLKFDANGLIPAIIQEQKTGRVLMMAWMNRASLEKTIETGKTHFWSRSRQKFWMKGETSGHTQTVKDIAFDCDGDTLLIQVEQIGAACHEGYKSCFFRSVQDGGEWQRYRTQQLRLKRRSRCTAASKSVMDDFVPFGSRSYGLCFLLLFVARGDGFPEHLGRHSEHGAGGQSHCQKAGLELGHPAQFRVCFGFAFWPLSGNCHQHHQRAGGRAQFSIRLADALARRAALSRLARRAHPGNQHHALPVLSVRPTRS